MAKTRHGDVRLPRENFFEDGSKFPLAFPFRIGPRKEGLRREERGRKTRRLTDVTLKVFKSRSAALTCQVEFREELCDGIRGIHSTRLRCVKKRFPVFLVCRFPSFERRIHFPLSRCRNDALLTRANCFRRPWLPSSIGAARKDSFRSLDAGNVHFAG